MARVVGPDFVALRVREVEASARFYEERPGLRRAPRVSPEAVVFGTEPVPFAVRRATVDLDAVGRLGWGVALWMRCDDPQGLHDSLKEAGGPMTQEPFDGPFGRTLAFVDPDGYAVTVRGG